MHQVGGLLLNSGNDFRMTMADNGNSVQSAQVDVGLTFDVSKPSTLSLLQDKRIRICECSQSGILEAANALANACRSIYRTTHSNLSFVMRVQAYMRRTFSSAALKADSE
jgi:hypothetical protein